jgi:hypothetical protein
LRVKAGELPKPDYLWWTGLIRESGKLADQLGLSPVELEPYQYGQLENELGETASTRDVVVHIEYNPEFGYEDAVEMLKASLPKDLVDRCLVDLVSGEDEDDGSDQ